MRMLAKDPQDRWATLEEMVAALGAVPPAESDRVRTQMLTLARSTEAQALVEKFQTPPSPVPRDRLSDSIALADACGRHADPEPRNRWKEEAHLGRPTGTRGRAGPLSLGAVAGVRWQPDHQ
jgi:hypothetical protein